MAEEGKGSVREGLRNSMGLLVAFKEAVQETLEEARDRGDFSTDKAKALVQEAAQRIQHSVDDARERFDVVPRKEFDELKAELDALRARVTQLEALGGSTASQADESEPPSLPPSGSEPFTVD